MRCTECGFVYEDLPAHRIPGALLTTAAELLDELSDPSVDGRRLRRPEPSVWSAQEYACHLRDVLLAQRDRTILALVEHNPTFSPIHRDERVELAGYRHESLPEVLWGVMLGADLLARLFRGLTDEQLGRPCVYWYPAPEQRDVRWIGRHTVHEEVHHLGDVRRVLEATDGVGRTAP